MCSETLMFSLFRLVVDEWITLVTARDAIACVHCDWLVSGGGVGREWAYTCSLYVAGLEDGECMVAALS